MDISTLITSHPRPDLSSCVCVCVFRPVAEGQGSAASSLPASIMVSLPTAPPPPPVAPAPARLNNSLSNRKPGVLPANLEEMKVFWNLLCLTMKTPMKRPGLKEGMTQLLKPKRKIRKTF